MHVWTHTTVVEPLEGRRLLSAAWSTVDDFVYGSQYTRTEDMASDNAGGVYAVGYGSDASNQSYAIVRHKSATSTEWQTLANIPGTSVQFQQVAVAPNGHVYIAGTLGGLYNATIWKGSLNAEGTALSFSVVDAPALGTFRYFQDLSIDATGNVFAAGFYSNAQGRDAGIQHWFVRKQTNGTGTFATVDDYRYGGADARAWGVATVSSGPAAGTYVVGVGGGGAHGSNLGARWIVRKSTNGGSTWSNVDAFQLESSTNAPSRARGIFADDSGTLHVVGTVANRVRTGGTDKKPVYSYYQRWYLRNSADAGSTWSSDDVYPENYGSFFLGQAFEGGFDPVGVVTDLAGKAYVAGTVGATTATARSIVRTDADGEWATSDDFQLPSPGYAFAYAMTRDTGGNVYVGGGASTHWWVRSSSPAMRVTGEPLFTSSDQIRDLFSATTLIDEVIADLQ